MKEQQYVCLPLFALAVCTFAPPQIFFGVSYVTMALNDGYRYADIVLLLTSKRSSQRPCSRSLRYSSLIKKSTGATGPSLKVLMAEIARGNSAHNGGWKEGKDNHSCNRSTRLILGGH